MRLYAEADGRLRFAGKDPVSERQAAREIRGRKRDAAERLHERHMSMLGETEDATERSGTREVLHTVGDESEEELWRAWRTFAGI